MSILVLGTVALDTVKTPFGLRRDILGGSAVHFAMSARLFTTVNLVAIVGEDFPQRHINFLHRKGINLSSLIRTEGKSFRWKGEYKGDLNTALTLSTELGVLSAFKPTIAKAQRKIEYIFLANVDPEIQRHLLAHMRNPKLVGIDSMNFWIKHKRKELLRLLKGVDIYVANDQEARVLSGEGNLIKAAGYLKSIGPRMILIKKGEHGVLFFDDKFTFCLPAYPTDRVIDPTGAGDSFAGGFMGYLARAKRINEYTLKKAIVYGTVAASFNVQGFGASKTSGLSLKDLEMRIAEFKRYVLF